MAKLYGTADTTLVSAAFKESMSNVPGDLSGVYSKREQNFEDFTKTITEVFDNIYADDKKTWDLLADNAQETLDIMESGGNNSEYMMNLNQDIVEDYKTRLKAIPDGKKGDRERSRLRAEMNKYKSTMASSNDMFMAMVNNAANSSLMDTLGDDRKKLFDEILKDYNNGTSNTKPKYVDGELVYTLPGVAGKDGKEVTMSMRDISKGMTAHDPAYLNTTQKALTDFQNLAMKGKGNITPEMLVRFNRGLSKSMTNMDQIRMVSKEKFGNMAYSFEEVLTGQSKDPSLLADIFTSLENLGGIDLNDDGLVNEGDTKLLEQAKRTGGTYYNSAGNAVTLIDALQKDKTKYRDLLSGYLTETAAKDFYGYGVDQRTPKGGGGKRVGTSGPNQFFLGKQYIPAAAVTPDVNILNEDPKDIPARTAWNNTIFRKVDGQYQIYQDDAFVGVTKEQLRTTLEFSDKVGYDMSGAVTTPKVTAPEVPADFDKAFRNDEKKVVQYFKNNPNLYPGMKVERTTKDDPEDGNDTFRITMPNGTSKVFTADPLTGDKGKIQDAWDWINKNYENNEFAQ